MRVISERMAVAQKIAEEKVRRHLSGFIKFVDT